MIITNQNIIGSLQRVSSSSPSFVGLLDTYSGAAVGYSLRRLRTAYSGNCIKVRRASDSTELDIGFVSNVLDTASLATFCSGTDGFVSVWYDQTGNSKDMSQGSASIQSKIVSAGSLENLNGKPCIKPLGSGYKLISTYNQNGGVSGKQIFAVTQRNSATLDQCLLGSTTQNSDYVYFYKQAHTSTTINNLATLTSERLNGAAFSYTTRDSVYNALANQSIVSSNVVFNFGGTNLSIGYKGSANEMPNMQEFVIFENQTDQAAKETAINSFYNAY